MVFTMVFMMVFMIIMIREEEQGSEASTPEDESEITEEDFQQQLQLAAA